MTTEKESHLVITGAHNFTAIGHGAVMTAHSARTGLSRVYLSDDYKDREGNSVRMSMIKGVDDEADLLGRIKKAACLSLEELLESYFQNHQSPLPPMSLLLGSATAERPGPRYENACLGGLAAILRKKTPRADEQIIARGNASFMHAVEQAGALIAARPDTVCVIGCVDSLLDCATLDWLERDQRLSSESYGRNHALIAGEAVGFVMVESAEHAARTGKAIQAHITGLGLAEDPSPRASGKPGRAAGLTEACRTAIGSEADQTIAGVFCDLNGEADRAIQWSYVRARLFDGARAPGVLVHPAAGQYGDIGAASGAVLASVAAYSLTKGWFRSEVLVACSDDYGPCGAVVLEKGDILDTNRIPRKWDGGVYED